jgi:alginate O-acetyltransferase complex protein AlgI
LFKKTVIADHLAPVANKIFGVAEQGHAISLLDAWAGAISYTFQLYFDFSGYSDMAIGAALMFGIVLPINFNTPYRAASIIDFWKRWHMTLSRFLRDYVYFTLGGNRRGEFRRYVNLLLTMLIGGIWHGAGWTFLIWGALHGTYLVINHGWAALRNRRNTPHVPMAFAAFLTFLAVVFGWVMFRAKTIGAAATVYAGMLGQNGLGDANYFVSTLQDAGWIFPTFALLAASVTTWLLPTSWSQFMHPSQNFKPLRFHGTLILACWIMIIASFGGYSEFLYFQF